MFPLKTMAVPATVEPTRLVSVLVPPVMVVAPLKVRDFSAAMVGKFVLTAILTGLATVIGAAVVLRIWAPFNVSVPPMPKAFALVGAMIPAPLRVAPPVKVLLPPRVKLPLALVGLNVMPPLPAMIPL